MARSSARSLASPHVLVGADPLEGSLAALLTLPDEEGLDSLWSEARTAMDEFALRRGKRVRPLLLCAGWALARGPGAVIPPEVTRYAAALELLHTFLLIHDDVADGADLRRGAPSLHRALASLGSLDGAEKGMRPLHEDLAVVAGDHLFARSVEAMLESPLERAAASTRYLMAVCRQTAAGQYLDLALSRLPLSRVTLFQTLRVAQLKTARYGFVAPLVAGALLGGANAPLLAALERVGRHAGLAFQLRDDLLGLFGDPAVQGKPGDSDYAQGKRTFPLMAAYARADAAGRQELEALWALPVKDDAALSLARTAVVRGGGRAATERLIARATGSARRAAARLCGAPDAREVLDSLLSQLERRTA